MIEIDQHYLTHSLAFNRHIKTIYLLVMCLFIISVDYVHNHAQYTLRMAHMNTSHMYATRERGYLEVIEGLFTEIMTDGISGKPFAICLHVSFRFRSVLVCFFENKIE